MKYVFRPAYVSNIEYYGDKVQNASTYIDVFRPSSAFNSEGYVDNYGDNGGPLFHFYYRRDHLGNNREVWRAKSDFMGTEIPETTLQRTQYYPSGLPWESNPDDNPEVQNKKYNGKEFVEMHGLDETIFDWRSLYNTILRTPTPDPLSEARPWLSPYMWCSGNPVNRTDPSGLYDLPELTVTAPAPKNKNNYNLFFQQLNKQADRNTTQIPRITPPTPVFNLPTNTNNVVTSNKDEKKENSTLESLSAAINATGITADNVKIFTKRYAGKEIIYVTLSGTMAAANTQKALKAIKGVESTTIVLGIAVDAVKAIDNPNYLPNFVANSTVALVVAAVGSVPGFIIASGYYLTTGERPENLPNHNQAICPIDNTNLVIPNIKK